MRSCSYYYSRNQAMRFLNTNSLKLIIRGHEVQMRGFKYQQSADNTPLTLTLFSAPKYCDSYKNKGAVAVLTVPPQSLREKTSLSNLSNKSNTPSSSITISMRFSSAFR